MRAIGLLLLIAGSVPLAGQPSLPLLDRLSVTAPTAAHEVTVRGAARAVPANAHVIAVNTQWGHYAIVQAAADGSFELTLRAAPGASIQIKSDPGGVHATRMLEGPPVIDHSTHELAGLHGTIVRAPDGLTLANEFADSGTSSPFLPLWSMQGSIDRLTAAPGQAIAINATYTAEASPLPNTTPHVRGEAILIALSRPDGSAALDQNSFCSTILTPPGLPVERVIRTVAGIRVGFSATLQPEGNRLRGTISQSLPIPADLPAGYYRIVLQTHIQDIVESQPENVRITTFLNTGARRFHASAYLPIVKIGDPAPPRLYWALLVNTLVEGMRGVTSVEDRGRFGIASHITTASDRLIVPRADARSGTPIVYNIEPFALTAGLSDRGAPVVPPLIPFRFPSGGLTATVRRPDGTSVTIGPAPFRQIALNGPVTSDGNLMEGGGHITDPMHLTTLDPRFDITFDREGRHEIRLEGTIEDVMGTVWRGEGTFEIDVAAPMLIESLTIPGTPLEAGDFLARGVRVVPPVAADVEIRVRHAAQSRADRMFDQTISLRTNRFGVARATPLQLDEPGEYRVDITARHRDAAGKLWVGTQTFGSAVAPRTSGMAANGMRGTDDQPENRQQWFSRTQIGSAPGRGHVPFAFRSGDVTWFQDSDAGIPIINVQDVDGTLTPVLKPLYGALMPPGAFDNFAAAGEIPLHSTGKYDVHIEPESADLLGYSYRSVQRPNIRVREEISDQASPAPYWRFNDLFGRQSGNGRQGDLPNDFKFQFGAAVLRGRALPEPRYAIYGSLFVLVPDDDLGGGTRTFPPFQANGGGPSGGPLFTLDGKDIDLFFHPMSIRPGTIYTVGMPLSFAGYSAPPLPSKVEIEVTSPTGRKRTILGQANRIGWFYDPAHDVVLSEPGLWRAKVKIVFDGSTSAGPVSEPYPSGDVLGSDEGEFSFYVADARSPALEIEPLPQFVKPNQTPLVFRILPPPDLTNIESHTTVTMPGFLLDETSGSLEYRYDPHALAQAFPNLDLFENADIVTFSFFVNGTDSSGVRRHLARQVVLNGEELHMPDQPPIVKRRAVR